MDPPFHRAAPADLEARVARPDDPGRGATPRRRVAKRDLDRARSRRDLERRAGRQVRARRRAIERRRARSHAPPLTGLRADVAAATEHDDARLAPGELASQPRAGRDAIDLESDVPPGRALRRDAQDATVAVGGLRANKEARHSGGRSSRRARFRPVSYRSRAARTSARPETSAGATSHHDPYSGTLS